MHTLIEMTDIDCYGENLMLSSCNYLQTFDQSFAFLDFHLTGPYLHLSSAVVGVSGSFR